MTQRSPSCTACPLHRPHRENQRRFRPGRSAVPAPDSVTWLLGQLRQHGEASHGTLSDWLQTHGELRHPGRIDRLLESLVSARRLVVLSGHGRARRYRLP